MKIRINTERIKSLNPCQDRLDNWMNHYSTFNGDIIKFLQLENITIQDRVWVATKILPISILEVFAIDCAFAAAKYAASDAADYACYAADYATYTAVSATYTAYAANYAANYAAYAAYAADAADAADAAERNNQIEALIYLIRNEK